MAKVELFQIKDGILEAVASSFGKTIEELNQDVEILKQWLQTQKHLPELMDEKQIQNFLILNKCNMEKTKHKLEMYYVLPPQMRSNPKQSAMKELLDTLYLVPLPVLTEDMYRVFVVKVRDRKRCEALNPYNGLSQVLNIQEIRMMEDVAYGDIFIVDCGDFPLKFLLRLKPKFLHKAYEIYAKVYSARIKAVYVLNASLLVRMILAFVKTLAKAKIIERIHDCSDASFLHNRISNQILPKDFGGEGQSLDEIQEMLKAKFVEYQYRFDQMDGIQGEEAH